MRNISFGLAVGFLLVACGGADEVKPPQTPTAPVATTPAPVAPVAEAPKAEPKPAASPMELQKKTMSDMAAALQAHDAKKLASLYTENAVMKFPGMPDVVGREAIAQMWQKNFDMFANSKGGASRVFVKGDVVVSEWVFTGSHAGDVAGVKATEKPIGVAGADVMWFTPEGLIKESHTYMDMGTIMSQIGVSKQKARAIPALPTGAPQVVVAVGTADEQKNADSATKMMGAFEKKSDVDFMAGAADDIAWEDMTQPETMKGKDAGKKYFKMMTTAFPDVKMASQNVWGVGDFVIAEGTMSGTHKGALGPIQPTKKSVNLHGLDVMQFKDGKIVKGWSYGNGGELMMQLGQMPAPGKTDAKAATPAKTDAKPAAPAKTDAKAATPAPAAAPAKK